MNKKPIYGPDGKPINEPTAEPALPTAIQALIETRVSAALQTLRQDARDATLRGWIKYGALVLITMVVGLLLWLYGPAEVRQWTQEFVATNMNKPTLEAAAKDVVTNRMGSFVSEKLQPLDQRVASVQLWLSDTERKLKQLQDEQRVIAIVSRAEAFDHDAFIQLTKIAQGTNDVALLAGAMVRRVTRELHLDKANTTAFVHVSLLPGGGIFSVPLTSDEYALALSEPTQWEGVINEIGEKKLRLFVPKLVELAHSSKDLAFRNRVSLALNRITGVEYSPYDVESLDKWWTTSKAAYSNWPFAKLDEAMTLFSAIKYREALKSFEAVLAADPTADRSRALGIACATETGDFAKARSLNTGYHEKDGRWERWARAKMVLATNGVDQATTEFASLAKSSPVMVRTAYLQKGSHVLRNLNWVLFELLTGGSTNAEPGKPGEVK